MPHSSTPPGVVSLGETGGTQLKGPVTLTEGANVTITQSGQAITIAAAGGAAGANTALSNLAAVAINLSLISDTDITDDLGSLAIRWKSIYASVLSTGDTALDTLLIQAYDVDGAAGTTFITLTAGNTPQCDLSTGVTMGGGNYIYYANGANDVGVTDGGTGVSLLTAYAVICGGVTQTSSLQTVASVGTAGQPLVSNGAAALPSFQSDLATAVTIGSAYIYRASGTDVPVADGGTGLSATTAYAVLCGGTTTTAALQSIAGVGSSGQVLTSNGAGALPTFQAAGGGNWTMVKKTSTESIISDNTLNNDSVLLFAVSASLLYAFRFIIFYDTPAAADFQFTLTVPAGYTLVRWEYNVVTPAAGSFSPVGCNTASGTVQNAPGTGTIGGYVEINGILENGVNVGNVTFRWAQLTSTASNTSVLLGSFLEWTTI